MPNDPTKPLLRLNDPHAAPRRRSGGGGETPRAFGKAGQNAAFGPIFQHLKNVLDRENAALELRADPNSLAPERLLVFKVTGSVQNFITAVARVPGLEFAGEEELEEDDLDGKPEYYLLVPQEAALREMLSLWQHWQKEHSMPRGYAPWGHLFAQLKSLRPWGPQDRVIELNRDYFLKIVEGATDAQLFRIEIELVFRGSAANSQVAEALVTQEIVAGGGAIINRTRRTEFAYHAILADVPAAEIRRIANLDQNSLAGLDPIAAIVPQSVGTLIEAGDAIEEAILRVLPTINDPIVAVFDAVPVQAHPLLAGRLTIDDPDNLEALAVGERVHGTAMASLVVHGDLNEPASPISRLVYFRPVMYAPGFGNELFNSDKLVIDVVYEAVVRMRQNGGTNVIVVNLSLGDSTKPFSGKISTWARALDYLAYTHGILFLVSAGNIPDGIPINDFPNSEAFNAAESDERAQSIFRALDGIKAQRRVIAPADSVNSLTVGAWHRDNAQAVFPNPSPFRPYGELNMPNLSSRLGPGLRRAAKPDVLFAGGRERAEIDPANAELSVRIRQNPSRYWGLKVAAPPQNGIAEGTHFTLGTSGATALATHTAHRVFDALEGAYPQLIAPMPPHERAALIKALLVHSASWKDMNVFIRGVVDPENTQHHETWRREVSRHLGYGFVDPEDAVACTADRATMWGTGNLGPGASIIYDVPLPLVLAASAASREVRATLAWFTPVRPGHLAYRAVKLKIASPLDAALALAGVGTFSSQPTNTQSESGTVVHRRWRDSRIGLFGGGAVFPIHIQREKDQGTPIDEPISYALTVSVEMPGQVQVYEQVRTAIAIKPQVVVNVGP